MIRPALIHALSQTLCALCALCALSSCGSSAPETRYYQMSLAETPLSQAKQASGELVLSMDYMSADAAYDDTRIVYRKSPYQLDYYHSITAGARPPP